MHVAPCPGLFLFCGLSVRCGIPWPKHLQSSSVFLSPGAVTPLAYRKIALLFSRRAGEQVKFLGDRTALGVDSREEKKVLREFRQAAPAAAAMYTVSKGPSKIVAKARRGEYTEFINNTVETSFFCISCCLMIIAHHRVCTRTDRMCWCLVRMCIQLLTFSCNALTCTYFTYMLDHS